MAPSAIAGRYVMVRHWPTGIHEAMFDMDARDEPDCERLLQALNSEADLHQRYSWLSPPKWSGSVTPVRWSPVRDADKVPILKAEAEAKCTPTLCNDPPSFWDSAKGRKRSQDIVANKEIQFDWAKVALDGKAPVTVIRTHQVADESQPNAGDDFTLFNSEFYVLLSVSPPKLVPVEFLQSYSADIVMLRGKTLFYGYSSGAEDRRGHPRSLIVIGDVVDPGPPTQVMTICEMAYHLGAHEPPAKGSLDPSFDCTAAAGRLERFICRNLFEEVGALDTTMADAYRAAVHHGKEKARLALEQRRWLASRTTRCPIGSIGPVRSRRDHWIATCLKGVYDLRIAQLRTAAGRDDPFAQITTWRQGAVKEEADKNAMLLMATGYGDLSAVERVISSGAKLNLTDGLYTAALRGSAPIVRRLLAAGADPNGVTPGPPDSRPTPLFVALEMDNREAADILLNHGGSISASKDGIPLLSHAVMTGRLSLVRQVLATHPNIDAPAISDPKSAVHGDTALIVAIERGYRDIVDSLLEAGADPNIAGQDGSPLAVAETLSGDRRIVSLLRSHGGRAG
jgi:uncharacterized protein YecT (DUF1311 family)